MSSQPVNTRLMESLAPLERPVGQFVSEKLPAPSDNLKQLIVRYLPWVFIVTGIFGLLLWLLGLLAIAAAGALMSGLGGSVTDAGLLGPLATYLLIPVELVLSIVAGFLLRQRQATGWYLALLAQFAGVVLGLFSFALGGLIWSLLAIWALFSVRAFYPPLPATASAT